MPQLGTLFFLRPRSSTRPGPLGGAPAPRPFLLLGPAPPAAPHPPPPRPVWDVALGLLVHVDARLAPQAELVRPALQRLALDRVEVATDGVEVDVRGDLQ